MYLKFIDYPIQENKQNKNTIKTNRIIYWMSIITIIPSIYLGYDLINKNQFNRNANKYISNEFNFSNTLVLKKVINPSKNTIQLFLAGYKLDSNVLVNLTNKKNKYNLENTKIEINQGATFEKNSNDFKYNQQNILEKQILFLTNILDSIVRKQENYLELTKELKFIDPNIDTGYIINYNLINTRQTYQKITIILETIKSDRKSKIDSAKITNWLKVRLPKDSIIIKIIK